MGRDARAMMVFAVTPLLAPALIAVAYGATAAIVFIACASYGCMVGLGLPAYLLICRYGPGLAIGWALALGVALGLASWGVTALSWSLLWGNGLASVLLMARGAALAGAVGSVVSLIIWRVTRTSPAAERS